MTYMFKNKTMNINFNKTPDNLIPAIIQDSETKNVLMLGGCTRLLMFSSNLKEITERYVNYAEKEGIRTEIVNNI